MNHPVVKRIFLLCFVLLLFTTCFLGGILYQLKTQPEPSLVGTFSTPEFPTSNTQYFVFTKDGLYHQYEQFTPLFEGRYHLDGHIITLERDGSVEQAVFSDGNLYYFDPFQNKVLEYIRYSDIPTYVNTGSQSKVPMPPPVD